MKANRKSNPVRQKAPPAPVASQKAHLPRACSTERIDTLGRQITNEREEIPLRGKALVELSELGVKAKHALPSLIVALNDSEEMNRELARHILWDLYPRLPERSSSLGSALASEESQVRLAAIRQLCTLLPEVKTSLAARQSGWQVLEQLLRAEEDRLNRLNTTGQEQVAARKWLAWNREQTRVVGSGKTRADAAAAAAAAGEEEPVLENVEKTRRDLADLYSDGEKICRQLLAEGGDPLTEKEVSELIGIAPAEVEQRRTAGSLLAVSLAGPTFLYPAWQFSNLGTLPGLPEVLEELRTHNPHPLAQLRFFLSRNLRLEGETPLSELSKGKIEEVRQAARTYGEHGAA